MFTAQPFENGVLGLAYISSPELNSAGGICSVQNRDRFGIVYYNTALSSAKATHGGTVVTREADLVTAHELGHNWGATHDDMSVECSPPYSLGGSYVMNTFSVSGYDENNDVGICFEPEMSSFCGNGRVENDTNGFVEECDVGGLLSGAVDNGKSGECPEPGFVKDGTPCIEDGECRNGHCLSFCERPSVNKKPCMCSKEADACLRCCRSENGTCEPYSRDAKYVLKDGTRCIHGTCRRAVCIKEVADVVSHLWNIIENLDETNFWKFVGDNLVGIILSIVLLIWIPASILVHRIDKAREAAASAESENRIQVVGEKSIYKYINPCDTSENSDSHH
ncbi:unnamed protein product [Gongylonema pulchrum]|uniref:Peptidase M12B domain-containing protein n=1 Tax=Gongylonema pulchrum TaxID=637853 RepID=A0A3P7MUH6_9BILA|nr:unnamed protein product [Gongylonema pulchrum]